MLDVGEDGGARVGHHHGHRVDGGVGLEVGQVEAPAHGHARHLVEQDLVSDGASENIHQRQSFILRGVLSLSLGQRRPFHGQGCQGLG